MNKKLKAGAALFGLLFLCGCLKVNSSDNEKKPEVQKSEITGFAIKGPIENADVTVYKLNSDGAGEQIGSAKTDTDGSFKVDVGSFEGIVSIEITGGSFIDESTEQKTSFPTAREKSLKTALNLNSENKKFPIVASPLTSMAYSLVASYEGGFTEENITKANSAVSEIFGDLDIHSTIPINPLVRNSKNGQSTQAINYGLLLGGISRLATNLSLAETPEIVFLLSNDIADGQLDGLADGKQLHEAYSGKKSLLAAVKEFTQSRQNYADASLSPALSLIITSTVSPKTDVNVVINALPVARAGANLLAELNQPISLDGSNSYDPEGRNITFIWTIKNQPEGANLQTADNKSKRITFVANVPGTYEFDLVVNDGEKNSFPDSVVVRIPDPKGVQPSIVVSGVHVYELEKKADIVFELLNGADGIATFNYTTQDKTAFAGEDYIQTSGSVSLRAATNKATVSIPIVNDYRFEGDESFKVALSNVTGAKILNTEIEVVILEYYPIAAPQLVLEYDIKQLLFSWNSVAGASQYRLHENFSGLSGFEEIARTTGTTYRHEISLPDRRYAQYLLEACDAIACTLSNVALTKRNLADAIGYIKASNTQAGDNFGFSIAISGDGKTLVIGAAHEDSNAVGINGDQTNNSNVDSGAIYVFVKSENGWLQQAYIKGNYIIPGGEFGSSIALSYDGNTMVVGAQRETNTIDKGVGRVYIYTRQGINWSTAITLRDVAPTTGGLLGWSTALSDNGNTLVIGVPEGTIGSVASGYIVIWKRANGDWVFDQTLVDANSGAGDYFGSSVAISADGTTIAVGAVGEDSSSRGTSGDKTNNGALNSGSVYIYTRGPTAWTQQAFIKSSNSDAYDNFGFMVALSSNGKRLVASAPYENSGSTQIGGDQSDNSSLDAGAVYVFDQSAVGWVQTAYLKASNAGASDEFGFDVKISRDGNRIVVGALREDSGGVGVEPFSAVDVADSGTVYVYDNYFSQWFQTALLKASNTSDSAGFGTFVAVSGNGQTIAVSAPGESSNATGIGGDQSNRSATNAGAVYLY